MRNFQLTATERVLREESAARVKSSLGTDSGKLYLTDQRLVFVKKNGSVKSLFTSASSSGEGDMSVDLALGNIKDISMTPTGKKKYILMLDVEGLKREKFVVTSDFVAWEKALNKPVNLV